MVEQPQSYYDGSRMLSWLSDYTGTSVDQTNFVVSQLAAIGLASLFRTTLHPSQTNSATRHGFGLIFGLIIGYFCFGVQAIHLAGLPALCYIVIRTQNPQIMQRLVLVVAITYLALIHLHRQIYDYGSYTLDITGPLMVITQKVTSLAFSIHDGLARTAEELNESQKRYAIKKIPTALEYFSYSLCFPALMAGPVIFYKDYKDFIQGNNFIQTPISKNLDSNSNSRTVVLEPSPTIAVCKKVVVAILCALIFVKYLPMFPIGGIKDDALINETSLAYKFWYIYVATLLVRFKYYFAWVLADAICNSAGIGFNGYDEHDNAKWDGISNVDILKFETGRNFREIIDAWNIGTNRWLRMVVYDRVKSYSTLLTYALSAVWHGFYPGYYLMFAGGALFTLAARTMRRHLREYFTHSFATKLFYDILTSLVTRLVVAYNTFSFVLLEFWPSVRMYLHMYLCLHILAALALVIVPLVIPKPISRVSRRQSSHNNVKLPENLEPSTTNGSLTQALKLDNVKNHND